MSSRKARCIRQGHVPVHLVCQSKAPDVEWQIRERSERTFKISIDTMTTAISLVRLSAVVVTVSFQQKSSLSERCLQQLKGTRWDWLLKRPNSGKFFDSVKPNHWPFPSNFKRSFPVVQDLLAFVDPNFSIRAQLVAETAKP